MLPGNMMRVLGAVAGVAMVLSGCAGCDNNKPVDCTDTTITFETPTADQTVDSPFEVSVVAKNPDGSSFAFDAATLKVGDASFTATVSGNRASFTDVSAAAGSQTLSATIASGTCTKTVSSPVTIRSTCAAPSIRAVSTDPTQDTQAPLGELTQAELPQGVMPRLRVEASCVSGLGLKVHVLNGSSEIGPPTEFTNGVANVPLTVAGDFVALDLRAELLQNGLPIGDLNNPAARVSLVIDLRGPACALTTSGPFGPSSDVDATTPGLQMAISGTVAQGSVGALKVGTAVAVSVAPAFDGSFSSTASFTTSGVVPLSLTCTASVTGNTTTVTGQLTITLDAPTLIVVSPLAADGGAPTITQSPTNIVVSTSAPDGSRVRVTIDGQGANGGTVASGMATIPVSFGADGLHTVVLSVTDLVGNVSAPVTVVLNVVLAGCGALFTRPGTCPALVTPSQFVGGAYSFVTQSKASCVGQSATLFRTNVLSDGGVSAEAQVIGSTVAANGLATYGPLSLTSGDYVFRAAVADTGTDGGVSTVSCLVTVDLDGPAITSPQVPANVTFATLNLSDDADLATPGAQRPLSRGGLTFSARVPVGGRVDVCTTQGTNELGMARPTSTECGVGWYVLRNGVVSPASDFTFPEGQYQIKIVVVGGGLATAPSSTPLSLLVDVTPPCVQSITLPQNQNGDAALNGAELVGGPARMAVTLGCGDTPATLSSSLPIGLRDVANGAAGAAHASTASFASGIYSVVPAMAANSEVDLNLFVELTDAVGNKNTLALNSAANLAFRVDPVLPNCDVASPTTALVGQAGAPGGNFPVQIATAADVGTNGVQLTFGSFAVRQLTPSNGLAPSTYALTGTSTYAIAATCTDRSGNSRSLITQSVTVDLDAPTCTLTQPASGTFNTNRLSTSVTVTGADGQNVTISSTLSGGVPITTGLTVVSGTASAVLSYPKGTQSVSADVKDAAGNSCATSTVTGVNVVSDACLLQLAGVFTNANGSWKNRLPGSTLSNLTATSGTLLGTIANSADCLNGVVATLDRRLPAPLATPYSTTTANGAINFDSATVTLNHGEVWTVTTFSPGTGTTSVLDFGIDLGVPVGSATVNNNSVTPAVPTYFVASSDNANLDAAFGTPKVNTYFADQGGGAGSQAVVRLTSGVNMVVRSLPGSVDILYGQAGQEVSLVTSAAAVTNEPYTLAPTTVTLAHNTVGNFVVRLTSAGGNFTDVISNGAAVDVLAPGSPLQNTNPSLTSARNADVRLTWTTVFDDATDPASAALDGTGAPMTRGYDLRWTTNSVVRNNSLATNATFASSSTMSTIYTSSDSPKDVRMPPLNTYFINVRARDEVGNYSPFDPAQTKTLVNMWGGSARLAPIGTSVDFGQTIEARTSVVGDSNADAVIAAPTRGGVGSVYIFRGKASFSDFTGTCTAWTAVPAGGADCIELTPPDGLGNSFGFDVSTDGNVVEDSSGPNVADIIVSQKDTGTLKGRVIIFVGSSGDAPTKFVEIRDGANPNLGWSARAIKDVNGDGFDELTISDYLYGGGRGRIYIFLGRPFAGVGSWQSLVPNGQTWVNLSTADWVVEASSILNPANVTPLRGNGLGLARSALISTPGFTGKHTADGGLAGEILVTAPRVNTGAANLFGYDLLSASSPSQPVVFPDAGLAFGPQTANSLAAFTGYGAAALAGAIETAQDLYISNPFGLNATGQGVVSRYSNWVGGLGSTTESGSITGPPFFGQILLAGNLDAATTATDLVVGEGNSAGNGVWILFQQPTPRFPSRVQSQSLVGATAINFWLSEFRPTRAASSSYEIRSVAVGPVNGSPALLVADELQGVVYVWRQ